jgi:hypothetical protein
MEIINRTPFQGIINIIRFNWHLYIVALLLICAAGLFPQYSWVQVAGCCIAGSTLLSLFASWYIYDHSELYNLQWLNDIITGEQLVNIHAGFDETSALLVRKYPTAGLQVFDFYNPVLHTEVSIERARKIYPPYPGTRKTGTDKIPLAAESIDTVFLLLAAHEIRDQQERITFFKELQRALKADGQVIVLEHLRDFPNGMVYTVGCLHFFSRKAWKQTFVKAQLTLKQEKKITPFLSVFILQKNGIAS